MKKRESLREKIAAWKETLHYGAGIAAIIFGAIVVRITQGTAKDITKKEEQTREKFFSDYPSLALNRWDIPVELYHPEVAPEIVYAISTLLDASMGKLKETPLEYFYFHETGRVDTEWGTRITAEEMQYHLACVLGRSFIKRITDEDDYDFYTAQKFCRWLIAAVTARPDLLPDYTGTLIPNTPLPPVLRFAPKKRWRADRMHGWK